MDSSKVLPGGHRAGGETSLGRSAWETAAVYVAFALVGAGVGWLVGPLAGWLDSLPWTPIQGPAKLVASAPVPALAVAGTVAGLVVGLIAQDEELVVRVSDEDVTLKRKSRSRGFPHASVAAAFRDGKQLVLLGRDGGELAREECDVNARRLAAAFTAHGYTWADDDPHAAEFRRWVPHAPALPHGANAVLTARGRALEKHGPSHDDVRELREELSRLGVVVRDDRRRQYWRPARPADAAAG